MAHPKRKISKTRRDKRRTHIKAKTQQIAKDKTIINRVYHLDRGYEGLEKKLRKCKANISRIHY